MYISIVCELFKAVCKENNVGYITKTMKSKSNRMF